MPRELWLSTIRDLVTHMNFAMLSLLARNIASLAFLARRELLLTREEELNCWLIWLLQGYYGRHTGDAAIQSFLPSFCRAFAVIGSKDTTFF